MSRRAAQRPGPPPGVIAVALASVGVLFFLPLAGLVARAPWRTIGAELGSGEVRDALRLSMVCSLSATAVAAVLGVPIAWMLARARFRGIAVVRALATMPMVVPPVVGGLALLLAFGRNGIAGRALFHLTGVRLPFTTAGAVLAEAFVAMPFFVLTVEAGLRAVDERYMQAAATLGARPWTAFRRVALPLAGPSLAAGAVLTWARALGEFGATITFAGNLRGTTRTMPLAVYLALQEHPDAAVALSLVLLAISIGVLVAFGSRLRPSWWANR